MIFLMKSGRVHVYPPKTSTQKLRARFEKNEGLIAAVLFDVSGRLRSDTYILVTPEHYKWDFKPISVEYTCALLGDDEPATEDNTMTRLVNLETYEQACEMLAMLLSMETSYKLSDMFYYRRFAYLVSIVIKDSKGNLHRWSVDKDHELELGEFFAESVGVYIDTDEFLDAYCSRADQVANGNYCARIESHGETREFGYYVHDRQAYLYMNDEYWMRDIRGPSHMFHPDEDGNPTEFSSIHKGDRFYTKEIVSLINKNQRKIFSDPPTFGISITGTGLIYLCPFQLAQLYDGAMSLEVTYYTRPRVADNLQTMLSQGYHDNIMAANLIEIMYIALLLPELIDMTRYFFDDEPGYLEIEFAMNRTTHKEGRVDFPEFPKEEAIFLDLFYVFAKIMLQHETKSIS